MKRKNLIPAVLGVASLILLLYFNLQAAPKFQQLSGGLGMLDMNPLFSTEQILEYRQSLSTQAKTYYLKVQLFDMLFPLLYALCFITVSRASTTHSRTRNIIISVASAAAVCDYTENFIIRGLLTDRLWTEPLLGVLGVVTCAKFALILAAAALIILSALLRSRR